MEKKKKLGVYWIAVIALLILSIILNLLAFIKPFANFYADSFYPILVNIMGPANNWSKVAFGELLMYFAAIVLLCEVLTVILLIFLRKKKGYKKFAGRFGKFTLFLAVLAIFLFTFTWLVPIRADHADTLHASGREYTFSDIEALRNFLVFKTNYLASLVEREESGRLIYKEDVEESIVEAVRSKSDIYPRLRGFYGRPKYALCSDFLEWSGIGGYTYVYTKEVSLNKYTSRFYFPSLYSHELAHYKGYFKESEANFLSYITLDESGDPFLAYVANVEMYYQYIKEAYENALLSTYSEENIEEAVVHYLEQPQMYSIVWDDLNESWQESKELYEAEEHPAEVISETVDEVSDYGWEAQDAILKEDNYDGVVIMLLEYYDGILY